MSTELAILIHELRSQAAALPGRNDPTAARRLMSEAADALAALDAELTRRGPPPEIIDASLGVHAMAIAGFVSLTIHNSPNTIMHSQRRGLLAVIPTPPHDRRDT